MTTKQLIDQFLLAKSTQNNLSYRTLSAYNYDLAAFLDFLKKRVIHEISAYELREFLDHLEKQKLAPASIRRKLAVLKVFYKFLEDEGIIDQAPTRKLNGRYRIPRRLPKVLSRQEIESLIRSALKQIALHRNNNTFTSYYTHRNHLMIEILFSTGIRIDELTKLNLTDINIENRSILIYGKGRKERLLYISSKEVLQIIKKYLIIRMALPYNSEALFINRLGKRVSTHSVGRIFTSLCNKAAITRKFTPHCLRHTMATMLIENGADVRSVQEILGHSSITTTEIYLSISSKRKRDVFNNCNQRNFMRCLPK